MKKTILNGIIAILIMLNVCVFMLIYTGMKPKCFVDGCNCARISNEYYCSKHLPVTETCLKTKNKN